MEEHRTWVGTLFNRLLGEPVLAVLNALGIQVHDPQHPIPDYIATELVIVLLAVPFFLWLRRRLSVDNPGGLQICFERLLTNSFRIGVYDLLDEVVGAGGRKHLAAVGSIGLFVLFCNSISLIPGFASPTAHRTVPLGCAMAVFVYYHLAGIRQHGGFGYSQHFIGHAFAMRKLTWPIVIPLFFFVEGVSHLSRLLSLTARLWANMTASELLYVKFLQLSLLFFTWLWAQSKLVALIDQALIMTLRIYGFSLPAQSKLVAVVNLSFPLTSPALLPIVFVTLHVFVAFVQAFVFTLLPIVYIALAVEAEH